MEYKPIIDKAQEFIGFFNEARQKVSKKRFTPATLNNFDDGGITSSRNHLVYTTKYGFNLRTPIGTIALPGLWMLSIEQINQFNGMLIEKFRMIEVGSEDYPMYLIPHDPNQPSLQLSLPPDADDTLRIRAVLRTNSYDMYVQYCKLRTGKKLWKLPLETLSVIRAEYMNWQEEVSKIDDTVPFTESTQKKLRSELGFNVPGLLQPEPAIIDFMS
jgi:hypothetical protein